jgi:hypothetical protein
LRQLANKKRTNRTNITIAHGFMIISEIRKPSKIYALHISATIVNMNASTSKIFAALNIFH